MRTFDNFFKEKKSAFIYFLFFITLFLSANYSILIIHSINVKVNKKEKIPLLRDIFLVYSNKQAKKITIIEKSSFGMQF